MTMMLMKLMLMKSMLMEWSYSNWSTSWLLTSCGSCSGRGVCPPIPRGFPDCTLTSDHHKHSQQQKFVLPLTFSEYLCQLPIDLSTVTIRQWSTDWTPGLPKPLILRVLGVQTPRLPRLPISHILRVLGVLESRLPRLPIASTF